MSFIRNKKKETTLVGRIIEDRNGYQSILCNSKEPGKQLVVCCGFNRIEGATTGDKDRLEYVTGKDPTAPKEMKSTFGYWRGTRVG